MKYEYWFAGIRNIPDRTKIKLKEKAGTAEAIYYIEGTGNLEAAGGEKERGAGQKL